MFDIIISSLLPITVILLLGFFAGYHQDFTRDQAGILNRMVMLYALPLTLFVNIVTTPFEELIQQKEIVLGLFIGMIGLYLVILILLHYVFKQSLILASLFALVISAPALAFVGTPVLHNLFGSISSISVAVGAVFLNLIQVPLTIILITSFNSVNQNDTKDKIQGLLKNILNTFKEPVVWAPLLALVFVLVGIKFPPIFISSFDLLGKATGGVALFASGIILFSYKVTFSKQVLLAVFAKNIVVPFVVWGIVYLLGFSSSLINETVLAMALPTASIAVILSIQYKQGERIVSSVMFLSTIFSIFSMGLFIVIFSLIK